MSLVGFKAKNHGQQVRKRGADDGVDERITPDEIFLPLNEVHRFTLDAAASPANAKCPNYFTLENSGLDASWAFQSVWCNPPYGRGIKDWVLKASQHYDEVVMLLPARVDTKWFHEIVLPNADVEFIKGRLKFGGGQSPAPFPSMIVRFSCCG